MPTKHSDLSIIVVSYNTVDLLAQCLGSLRKHLCGKIDFIAIVVDNNSCDETRRWLASYQADNSWVHAILLNDNVGFARANNIGIRFCTCKNVLLLNSDAYLIDDSLLLAVAHLDKNPGLFGCGCTLLDREEKSDISYGSFPSLPVVMKEICTNRFNQLRAVTPVKNDTIRQIDFPCGAFFLFKRNMFDELGGLDEAFFMYFEETDLAKRAWDKGHIIEYFPKTNIVHLRGGSSGTENGALTTIFYQSWNYYFSKHHSFVEKIALNSILYLFFSAMFFYSLISGKKKVCSYYKHHRRGLVSSWFKSRDLMVNEIKKRSKACDPAPE